MSSSDSEKDAEICKAGHGAILACADNIGAALADISALRVIKPIFDTAKAVSNLTLNPAKCDIAPLSVSCTPEVATAVSDRNLWN